MAIEVTLRQLRAFLAVLQCNSFSEAASSMHLSQAALSGLVKELENRLGVRLLDRNTRSVSASVVGSAFEPLVRRVLADLDEALQSVSNLKELRRGVLRVAAPEPLSCTLLPALLAGYAARYPGIDVRFEDVPIEQVMASLHSGGADVGFGPAGVPPDDMLQAHSVHADPLWVALRPDDPLADGKTVSWKALRDRPLINYMPNLALNVLAHVPPHRHPIEIVPVHRVNTALSLLRVRPGYVICPAMARSLVEGFGLAFRELHQPTVTWRIAMFARPRALLSPAVERFLDFVLEEGQRLGAGKPLDGPVANRHARRRSAN
ncbi:LysR family transcriptional regulator [Bordetella genomosp. 13]|uniref:LysR family transcriptional regulator n=1 Tax=Bordetella genomosp. 13 TaxID=463040 RepID=A0A1W6Z8L0_9BORD|nr:LysR family transcriptional regulator [Bordetella genomosp. 13]ARP93723.1 LysR family transcriptional regulator [Bordetella genomosp. 13]